MKHKMTVELNSDQLDDLTIFDKSGKKYKLVEIKDDIMTDKKIRVAIVIGHNSKSKGASSEFIKSAYNSEFDFWYYNLPQSTTDAQFFLHKETIPSYSDRQKDMADRTKEFDLVMELHFNAASQQANGAEALHWFSNDRTKKTAQFFSDKMKSSMGIKSRGAKSIVRKSERGGGFLVAQKNDAIILEPFFGSNESDVLKFNISKFIEVLNDTIEFHSNLLK